LKRFPPENLTVLLALIVIASPVAGFLPCRSALSPNLSFRFRQIGHSRFRGQIEIEVPRDRNSQFEPQLVKKNQTRFDGLDEKIISLYARGITTHEIQGHLEEIYGVDVSPTLISNVTDAVLDEVQAWQSRPLDSVYPILYLDALQVKVKSQGSVRNKAIYLASV
jgi:transposase-like protein